MTLTHDNPAGDFGDADWSAFAYVAGELAEAESAAWEARLAKGDVEACEAVARAVELVRVVAAAGVSEAVVETAAEESYDAGRWRSVVVAAAAVCLVLVVGLSWRTSDPNPAVVVRPDPDVDVLLSTWADGIGDEHAGERAAETVAEVAESELVVPDWMIAAVALPAEMSGGDDE